MDGEPTIEEMQAELLKYKNENEQLKTQNTAIQEQLDSTKNDLTSARKLNTQYYHQMAFGKEKTPDTTDEPEPHTETVEEFVGSFVDKTISEMRKIYGEDKVAHNQ